MLTAEHTKPADPLHNYPAYEAWFRSLTVSEYERETRRTYQETEYLLNLLDEHGDCLEIESTFKTKGEALKALAAIKWNETREDADIAEVEKCRTIYAAIDLDVKDKEYTTIRKRYRT